MQNNLFYNYLVYTVTYGTDVIGNTLVGIRYRKCEDELFCTEETKPKLMSISRKEGVLKTDSYRKNIKTLLIGCKRP